jgi:hypothetical protein
MSGDGHSDFRRCPLFRRCRRLSAHQSGCSFAADGRGHGFSHQRLCLDRRVQPRQDRGVPVSERWRSTLTCSPASRRLRSALALWVLAIASGLPWNGAQGQTLIDALVSTYSTNPDLLAQRARLRVVDESVNQAQAGSRPVVHGQGRLGVNRQNSTTSSPRRSGSR